MRCRCASWLSRAAWCASSCFAWLSERFEDQYSCSLYLAIVIN
jgi:hypothetical protein